MSNIQNSAVLYSNLITKAQQDEGFKAALLNDPQAAIKSIDENVSFSGDVNIVVTDQTNTDDYMYFNIPRKVEMEDMELSSEDLELVAGGTDPITLTALGIITTVWCLVGGACILAAGIYVGMND